MTALDVFRDGLGWLTDPLNWTASAGLLDRLREHLLIAGLAVLLACLTAWPVGTVLGHLGRGERVIRALANLTIAVPAVALLAILPLTPLGFTTPTVVVALAVFAVPPLLAGAHAGVRQVEPATRDAARGMGLTGGQLLRRVELPLAVPDLVAGLRAAGVQVIAATALVAFVGGGGLGEIIIAGYRNGSGAQLVAGAIVLGGLALTFEVLLAGVQRAATPARVGGRATGGWPSSLGLHSPAALVRPR